MAASAIGATMPAGLTVSNNQLTDLLHSRPATVKEGTRLSRWKMLDRRGPHLAFPIETAWLHQMIDFLSEAFGLTERR